MDCDFDTNFCGYYQDKKDDFDWTRYKGSTPTSNTGPSTDVSGNGYYVYIETSSTSPGEEARLKSPAIPSGTCIYL